MAIFAGESPLMLSGDAKKDLELIRNYIYERDMELRHILSHLDESNFVEGFVDKLSPVNNITNEYTEIVDSDTEGVWQNRMAFATASTTSAVAGGKDIDLINFKSVDNDAVFSNERYSSSYGYGIKCAKAGKYLVSATANIKTTIAASSPTVAIRKMVGGTSSYIAKAVHTFLDPNDGTTFSLTPKIVDVKENTFFSLYLSLDTAETKADGCWLTAVYLGE